MSSRGPRYVSCNMRENPSETSFHGFLGSLENSNRNAHWIMGAGLAGSVDRSFDLLNRATLNLMAGYLSRGRVMEARFDGGIIRLPNRARAIDGVMFRREAWNAQSVLDLRACCRLMPYGQGGPARVGTRVHFVNSVGHELVSPVPPVPRRDINSFPKAQPLFPLSADRSRRSP